MAHEPDANAEYNVAARDYAEATSRYESAAMSGSRDERLAAQDALEKAGERYAQALAATVRSSTRPAFEDVLTEAWSQPDVTSMILASIVEYNAARPAAASSTVRAFASRAGGIAQPWTSLSDLLTGATSSTTGATGNRLGRPAHA